MYKLIALDLDGTLLNDRKLISKKDIEAIKKVRELGIEVVIATGRRYWSARKFVKMMKMDFVVMANNGAVIRNSLNDIELSTKYISKSDYEIIVSRAKQRGLDTLIHVDHYENGIDMIMEKNPISNSFGGYFKRIPERYAVKEDISKYDDDKALAACFFGDERELFEFKNELISDFPKTYNINILKNMIGVSSMMEVLNVNSSKWKNIIDYALNKNIKENEIIAIGDDTNDIEMIKKCGFGIAMKNSIDEVKEISDFVTKNDNNNSGVYEALSTVFDIK